ncbi:electron transport complex subunit RsxD [Cobetia sp. cqz5-12]|uniref:electron transport complex subunit RsxD n=1 Tax=Cobetia sp. cqz5-12 TaxID=2609415 RepID=UPI00190349C6|nr:electron transport complex subunit RsxD [Cobetia sp. cqz5-12]QQK64742.1 electron transport complex subunit RsxD [Cobetia sp. cqz5-12]
MSLMHASSPHAHGPTATSRVMAWVLAATLPGIAVLCWHYGWGVLFNLVFACLAGITLEALLLKLRGRPVSFFLKDNSALVTCVLLAVSLPPLAPWWLVLTGVIAAIVVAKQLYGGLGQNPFNPAMVAYALLLISFPVEMSRWSSPDGFALGFADSLKQFFGMIATPDALTGATPLDAFRNKGELSSSEFWADPSLLPAANLLAWQQTAIAWGLGGLVLLARRLITWHIPVAMLGSLAVISGIFAFVDGEQHASPLFHLLCGAAIFGAFFIATDPVTAATSNKGKLYYGVGIGVLIYLIRAFGAYPDAIAFAVLLMNFSVPFIDYYTQPRSYGHKKARRGIKLEDKA